MKRGFKILSNMNRLGEFWKIKIDSLRMELAKSEVMSCQLRTVTCWSMGKKNYQILSLLRATKYVMYWTFFRRGIQHEDTGNACSLTYWHSYCRFRSDQRCSGLKANVLRRSYFPLNTPLLSNPNLLVTWYSFFCIWIVFLVPYLVRYGLL